MLQIVSKSDVPRCERCGISLVPQIVRNSESKKCVLCDSEQKPKLMLFGKKNENEKINEIIKQVKKNGIDRQFDCLVYTNGSRESIFLLQKLIEIHDLRCLVVFQHHPFLPKETRRYLYSLFAKWNLPFIRIKIESDFQKRLARKMILKYKKTGEKRFLELGCLPCKMIHTELYKIANATGIKTIFFAQLDDRKCFPGLIPQSNAKAFSIAEVLNQTPIKSDTFSFFLKLFFLKSRAKLFFDMPDSGPLRLLNPKIELINYFTVYSWDESECRRTLSELDFSIPDDFVSPILAHCLYAETINKAWLEESGLSANELNISHMARKGFLSHEKAVELIRKEGYISNKKLTELYKRIKLIKRRHSPRALRVLKANV